jgi:phosphoribosylglycinamide formyltransferase-1
LPAAVLISGGGTNLQAFIDAVDDGSLALDLRVVISNEADAFGLERARRAGIETRLVEHRGYASREAFDAALVETLGAFEPGLIILAGFMRILTPVFIDAFVGRIMNIHPSLLPKYPGLHTHQRAIDAGDAWAGSTVHFATAELDGGPRIIQGRVPVLSGDNGQSLAARVLEVEHRIYPEAARLFAAGRLAYRDGLAWLDGNLLEEPLQYC